MPRVVPSQVVGFINSLWPAPEHHRGLNRNQAGQLSGLIDLIDQIPAELLAMDSAVYAPFIWAKAHIRQRLLMWVSETRFGNELGYMPGQSEQSPVTVIRDALDQCDDESPAPGTSDLEFITDEKLRANLRNDIGVVHRALANSEWKAATVLAGSTAEALLLWALKQRQQSEITNAITALIASGGLKSNPDSSLDRWNLYEFIQVAENLGVIKPNTAKQTRLAKNFRNFIHPGVAQRLCEKCDRATAFSAAAGMEHIVRDLTP